MDATPILSSASPFDNRVRFASGSKTTVDVDALKPPWPYGRARHGASLPPPSPWRPPSGAVEHGGSIPANAEVPGPPHRRTIASNGYAMADACVDHGATSVVLWPRAFPAAAVWSHVATMSPTSVLGSPVAGVSLHPSLPELPVRELEEEHEANRSK